MDAGGHEGLAHEKKRAEREQEANAHPDRRDVAIREKNRDRGRREVDAEQPKNEQQHAGSVYPEDRGAREAGTAARRQPRAKAASPEKKKSGR